MNWEQYPVGTKAIASTGGYWVKEGDYQWRWCTGNVFPTPGGNVIQVNMPFIPEKPIEKIVITEDLFKDIKL